MNIALCADEKFTIPALVCITSIFENNKDDYELDFVYLLVF